MKVPPKSEDRCTGACCVRFPLPLSPGKLKKEADYAKENDGMGHFQDIIQVQDMVIPLGKSENAYKEMGAPPSGTYQDEWWDYTCKHFDKENRICRIYETRPRMCQNHGSAYPCGNVDCEWKDAKQEPELEKLEKAKE